jgi:hypothetical protein
MRPKRTAKMMVLRKVKRVRLMGRSLIIEEELFG